MGSRHIPTLDGWRGVAIALVLWAHLGKHQGMGQHGVCIFFVLSGFLITRRLMLEGSLRDFYRRRFFRLMPCAWLYLGFVAVLSGASGWQLARWPDLLGCLFFFRNYVVDELQRRTITAHFWSLAIEEQFYLVWPVVLFRLGRIRASYVAAAGAILLAGWRLHGWAYLERAPVGYGLATQYHADALLVGCLTALHYDRIQLRSSMLPPLVFAFAICTIWFKGPIVPIAESLIIAAMLVITTQNASSVAGRLLESRPLAFLGVISYSVYVWQQPFSMAAYNAHAPVWFTLPAALATGLASYYLVEVPAIQWGRCSELATHAVEGRR